MILQSHFKRARSLDPVTSHAAAEQVDFAGQHFDKIVDCLQRFGARGKATEEWFDILAGAIKEKQ